MINNPVLKILKYQLRTIKNKLIDKNANCFFCYKRIVSKFVFGRFATFQANVASAAPMKQDNIPVVPNRMYHIEKEQEYEQNLTHNMPQRFKKDDWFYGKLLEDILDLMRNYEEEYTEY